MSHFPLDDTDHTKENELGSDWSFVVGFYVVLRTALSVFGEFVSIWLNQKSDYRILKDDIIHKIYFIQTHVFIDFKIVGGNTASQIFYD